MNGAATDLLAALTEGGPIHTPVALVVCHPDDETIAAGATMARLLDLTLIHLTDGAADDADELRRVGFPSREAYAATRQRELDAALRAACGRPIRQLCYGFQDRQIEARLDEVVERLSADLMTVDAVITHAYEGGHMDHDACARACQMACLRLMDLTGRAPARLEFAGYYHAGSYVRAGGFWPAPNRPLVRPALPPDAARRREAALRCFASQQGNMAYFSTIGEAFRAAPDYDFSQPPPPDSWIKRPG